MSQENVEVLRGVRIALPPLRASIAAQRRTLLDQRLHACLLSGRFFLLRSSPSSAPADALARGVFSASAPILRGWAASDRDDLELGLCGYDPDVEISWPETGSMAIPHLLGTYRGHEGFRRVWRGTHHPWKVEVRPLTRGLTRAAARSSSPT